MIIYKAIKYLALFGVVLAVYLLWQQLFKPSFQPCNISSTVNCDAVITGPVAKTFGIPTPLIGLIGYCVIFLAASARNKKLILAMASFGLVFCLWIAYKELFELKVICPVCIACQLTMLSIFVLGIKALFQSEQLAETN